jgi:RimJ/RimL family protein N-acetyltransferase
VELETERLLLRRPEPRDVDAYAEFWADPDVVRYIGGATKTWAETKAGVDRMIRHWNRHGIGLFSIERKADGRLVGRAGFLLWDTKRWVHSLADELDLPIETEIGWTLGRAFWGVGYATEASIAARDWALEELGLRRLISLIQRPNTASVRVAEKLGETLERANIGGPFSRTTDLYALGAQPAAAGIPAR